MQIDLSRFRDTFFQEAEEHLANMEQGLVGLESSADQLESLNAVFRGAHSIKGASGTFGFDDVTHFTHAMESLLDKMRAGELESSRERVDLLLESLDVLRGLLAAARENSPAPANASQLTDRLVVALRAAPASGPQATTVRAADHKPQGRAVYSIHFTPSVDLFRQGMDPVLILRELDRMGEVLEIRTDSDRLPPLAELDPEACYLGWVIRLETEHSSDEIRDAFAFVEDGSEIVIEAEQAAKSKETQLAAPAASEARPRLSGSSLRVATEKVDKLIDLVGELVIAQSMAMQILSVFTPARLAELQDTFNEMSRYTRELQERVMSVRMLPIGTVFSRFPRLVRDLAAATGKEISLEMNGEETELDKSVVERMSDPLTHLIRNSIDHGLEPAEERIKAGKPAQGSVHLNAYHQGGNVMVEVVDDGRGLNADRIRKKAVERGLMNESDNLPVEQIYAMIFEPGFSTAEQVSDLSGRGVGMDVVKRNVEALNGTVTLASEPGRGTTVRIKLPLTLAILDGLLVKVGAETYVLPLVSILESLRPRREQLSEPAGRGELVVVRREPITLVRLHRLLGVPEAVTDPTQGLVVIVENQGRRLALLVDELLGQQQVVIKSLETHFRKVDAVVGATILGDGHPALILDVAGLAALAKHTEDDRLAA